MKFFTTLTTVATLATVIFLSTFTITGVCAMGNKDTQALGGGGATAAPSGVQIIRGMVKIYGNEPHTYAGIETEDGKHYAVYPAEKEQEIWSLQGRKIEWTVLFSEKPEGYGSLFLKDGTVTPLSWRVVNSEQ
ncbi:MAG: hypothetical protein LBT01_08660 [Spirochaetaceae bacterium]|jgi:hypothetical protein|nr:hypothetical protein [Spirochaetaceae bacterium]